MPDRIDFHITGLDQLRIKLKGLSDDLQYKGGRFALRKAANIIRDRAQQNAARLDDPATANEIAKNIVVRWSTRTFRATGDLAFRIGVLGGAKQTSQAYKDLGIVAGRGKSNPGGDTFYWRFLEFGTARTRAQPFMRPALRESADQVQTEFVRQYDKAIDRALRKQAGARR